MLKSKMGVSIALVGAAMFFLGAVYAIPACLLAGYVLICEENEWLRKSAAKMIGVLIFFGLCSVGVGMIDELVNMINVVVHWFDDMADYITMPADLTDLLGSAIYIIEGVVFVVLGFKALAMKTIKFGLVDKLVDKFM